MHRHFRNSLVLLLSLLSPAAIVHAQGGGELFNHKPPAAWPDWFVPPAALGVTTWLHSDETNLMGGEKPDHWSYMAKSRLTPDALVALVKSFAESHHFAEINVIDPHQKLVAAELDSNDPQSLLKAVSQHHNYVLSIEATDGGFELSMNQGAP